MANFTLNIATDSSAELLEIVSKIATSMPLPVPHEQAKVMHPIDPDSHQFEPGTITDQAAYDAAIKSGLVAEIAPAATPERDGHGIKRDDRIHANAADPFKADGTWKRRKNVPDEQYEEIHLELVREARAAGLYAGPAIPELELEDRVVDTTVVVENNTDAEVSVVETDGGVEIVLSAEPTPPAPAPVAPPAPAPAPAPVAPPAPTGMSAEATPTYQQAVMKLVQQAGPKAPVAMMRIMGVKSAAELTPEQLRAVVQAADMVTLVPTDKPTKGAQAVTEAFIALGVEVNVEQLADLGVSV